MTPYSHKIIYTGCSDISFGNDSEANGDGTLSTFTENRGFLFLDNN